MPESTGFDPKATPLPEPILGSYRLVQALASGGMSSVHRAVHMQTGHEVALKILPRALAKKQTMLQRFLREAATAESLQHPNIVSIFDRGFDQGRYYIVLEYVPGGDLHERVRDHGPLSIPLVKKVMRQTTEGLRYAYSKGMIHRDVKPANLLMSKEGVVKITDLGLVLRSEEDDERVTRDGTTVGTVDYMAPEQARDSRATSVKSDIYSLGCTAFYLLTGQAPFSGGTLTDKLRKHAHDKAPDVRELRQDAPLDLSLLLQRMMAKRPEDRFNDHDELLCAIDDLDRPKSSATLKAQRASTPSAPLPMALLDDDDGLPYTLAAGAPSALPQALFDDEPPPQKSGSHKPSSANALHAQFDDDDDEDDEGVSDDSIGLGKLDVAALEAIEGSAPASRRPTSSMIPKVPGSGSYAPVARAAAAVPLAGEEPDDFGLSQASPTVRSGADSMNTWIVRGLGIGLAIVFGIVIIQQLVALSNSPETEPKAETNLSSDPGASGPVELDPSANGVTGPKPILKADLARSKGVAPDPGRGDAVKSKPAIELSREASISPEQLALYMPNWGVSNDPMAVEGPRQTLRRLATNSDPGETSSFRKALDAAGGTIEAADSGPFFIDDPKMTGKSRRIQASKGARSTIVIVASEQELVRDRPALVTLEESKLELEGIDLVVDLRRAGPNQKALFCCKGSELNLIDCTVTFVGGKAPVALVRVEAPLGDPTRVSRIKLYKTFARGNNMVAFAAAGGVAEAVVFRSTLVCGANAVEGWGGSRVPGVGREPARGKWSIVRSCIACKDAFFEHKGSALSTDSEHPPFEFRILGSFVARIEDQSKPSLIHFQEEYQGEKLPGLVWLGSTNQYIGWPSWSTSGSRKTVNMEGLEDARKLVGADERQSKFDGKAIPASFGQPWASKQALAGQIPAAQPILALLPRTSRWLKEETLAYFGAPDVSRIKSLEESASHGLFANASETAGMVDLAIEVGRLSEPMDLGAFLQEHPPRSGATRVRLRLIGTCREPHLLKLSPVRMPKGVGLELVGDPTSGANPNQIVEAAAPAEGADALLAVEDADLILRHMQIKRGGERSLKCMLRVTGGSLLIDDCKLTATTAVENGGGNLASFKAMAAPKVPRRAGRFAASSIPCCWLGVRRWRPRLAGGSLVSRTPQSPAKKPHLSSGQRLPNPSTAISCSSVAPSRRKTPSWSLGLGRRRKRRRNVPGSSARIVPHFSTYPLETNAEPSCLPSTQALSRAAPCSGRPAATHAKPCILFCPEALHPPQTSSPTSEASGSTFGAPTGCAKSPGPNLTEVTLPSGSSRNRSIAMEPQRMISSSTRPFGQGGRRSTSAPNPDRGRPRKPQPSPAADPRPRRSSRNLECKLVSKSFRTGLCSTLRRSYVESCCSTSRSALDCAFTPLGARPFSAAFPGS